MRRITHERMLRRTAAVVRFSRAIFIGCIVAGVAVAAVHAQSPNEGPRRQTQAPSTAAPTSIAANPAIAVTPTGSAESVSGLLYVRPFTLERPYRYLYSAEQLEVSSGFLIVLEVDRTLAQPRNFAMPALYVGSRPIELLNFGHLSGRVVAIVPGDTDFANAPAYFGSTELPERVDATRGVQELAAARAIGVRAFPPAMVEAARAEGGAPLAARDIDAVYEAGSELILIHAPEEQPPSVE